LYLLGERVHRIVSQNQGVTVITGQGSRQARAVVLATGFGSPLVRQAGLGSVSDYVTGVQAVVSTDGVDEVEVHLGSDVAPGFFSYLVPTLPGRALVGLLSRKKAQTRLTNFIQKLRQAGKIKEVVNEAATWGIPLRPLKRTYLDRMVVVGDAAGQVKPTTGGGIYYSLLAGEAAAQVLSEALADDDLSSGNLSRYQSRWRDLLAAEIEVGYSARRLYEFLTDQQIGALVKRAAANGFNSELVDASEGTFDWHGKMIAQIMGNPGLGGALRLINPLLARLAHRPDIGTAQSQTTPAYHD
jgi:flavin-dependent dehydrogenase